MTEPADTPTPEEPMIHITPLLLPGNHTSGRSGHKPEAIVIHIMEGSMEGTLSWFRSPASKVSAHYGVSRAGEVVQYVAEGDTAWHAGRVLQPTAALVLERPGVNPNLYTIGVEHEGEAEQSPTAAQLRASAELLREISERWSIPLDARHVIPHHAVYAAKTCPGRINVDALILLATDQAPAPAGRQAVPIVPAIVPGLAEVPRPPLVTVPPNLTPAQVPDAPPPRDWSEPEPPPSLWARLTTPLRSSNMATTTTTLPAKPWYLSKTVIFNVLVVVATLLGALQGVVSQLPVELPGGVAGTIGFLVAAINFAMRFFSSQPVAASAKPVEKTVKVA